MDSNYMSDYPEEVAGGATEHLIKVIGVGGGGCNVVKAIQNKALEGVDLMVCNTDAQSVADSSIAERIVLGSSLARQIGVKKGLGAGCDPERGRLAAEASIEELKKSLSGPAEMIFIMACMGGGTGTGASPVIAKLAKDMGKLTVAVATLPFRDEGPETMRRAIKGIGELQKNVDSTLIIDNQKIYDVYANLTMKEGFEKANEVLVTAVKSITGFITKSAFINVDFADVRAMMKDSGMAIMGTGTAEGKDRAEAAVRMALESPLINEADLTTSKGMLISICCSENSPMTELNQVVEQARSYTGNLKFFKRGIIWDNSMGKKLSVTIIVTGFEAHHLPDIQEDPDKVVLVDSATTQAPPSKTESLEKPEQIDQILLKDVQVEPFSTIIPLKKPALVVDDDIQIIALESRAAYLRRATKPLTNN